MALFLPENVKHSFEITRNEDAAWSETWPAWHRAESPNMDNSKAKPETEEERYPLCYIPLLFGCKDNWTWNRRERSSQVRLFGKNSQIAHFHPTWSSGTAGVRGTRILNNGRYFWELLLSKRVFGTSMMFGIGTRKARLHADAFTNLLGEDSNSWGLSHKGTLWHGGICSKYTKPFRENVPIKIGVYFDGIAGTLTYFKNGTCLGVAFRGLQDIKEPLFPIISSTAAKTEMVLDSMRREFGDLQDRCRAVIVRKIKDRKELDKLCLPPIIKNYIGEAIVDTKDPRDKINFV